MGNPHILVINCGSSSLKFSLIEPASGRAAATGLAERLTSPSAQVTVRLADGSKQTVPTPAAGHEDALGMALALLRYDIPEGGQIAAVGHRVVHGGEAFADSIEIDEDVTRQIEECADLAPLHNPANLIGIRAAMSHFHDVPHVAVFDTAFHQSMPPRAYFYALPYEYYERFKVRRYGFHGTSHRYVAGEAARLVGKDLAELDMITLHLGNGCSACAVRHGRSADTTMGFTPLEGLVMGTRCGDIDPNLHQHLCGHTGKDLAEITDVLNRQSGLLGLSGKSNDMRTLEDAAGAGDVRASLAIDVFCYRLAKATLGLAAALDRIDALVFTGGIGENSPLIRQQTLSHLRVLKPELDPVLNQENGRKSSGLITTGQSALRCLVVPTNEELVIARETARFVHSGSPTH